MTTCRQKPNRIVLLPGMDGTGELFSPLVRELERHFELTVASYPSDGPLAYGDLSPLVRAACAESGPYVLLAESFSTPLAIEHAASANKGDLQALILCAGFAACPVSRLRRLLAHAVKPLLFRSASPRFAIRRLLLNAEATAEEVSAVQAAIRATSPETLRVRLGAVLDCNVLGGWARVNVPTLYLQAQQDRLVHESSARQMRSTNPGMRTVSIEGPHLLLQSKPAVCAKAIRGFLQSISDEAKSEKALPS